MFTSEKECIAMLLAGGRGSRLYQLTDNIAKPAVTFAGKYRIIDYPLSNCVHSGIDTVGVLTQYRPLLLNSYIGKGQSWDLDRLHGGVTILPPYHGESGGAWYSGTANAIYQNIPFVDSYSPEYVLILSGDHIYKMDYSKMIAQHKATNADCTIAVIDVPREEASRYGIMNCDDKMRIVEFEEKPKKPKSTLASMGVYIFTWDKLRAYLKADNDDVDSDNDFGKNVIPHYLEYGERCFAYQFDGYWKDVGTIDSLWQANMDMLTNLSLDMPEWQILSRTVGKPPQYIGPEGEVTNCLMTEGCEIYGKATNCIISGGVVIEEGAEVHDTVIMFNCRIGAGAKVTRAILNDNAQVPPDAEIGSTDGKIAVVTA
ncbi:MAG: glucose-1-phosphate adenylyltransferase [Oscillospiraceae bacterium]|jgi:glucose-1-phosphate adenylyltransferase|nr:glucose-1-phosphate adenylyltransferase [Oscillospiraceae bacterium]